MPVDEANQSDDSTTIPVRVNRPVPPEAPAVPTQQPTERAPDLSVAAEPEPEKLPDEDRIDPTTPIGESRSRPRSELSKRQLKADAGVLPKQNTFESLLQGSLPGGLIEPAEPESEPEPELQPGPPPEPRDEPAVPKAETQPVTPEPASAPVVKRPKLALPKAVAVGLILLILGGLGFAGYRFVPGLLASLDLKSYENQSLKFAINQPAGWQSDVVDQPQIKQVVFREPAKSDSNKPAAQLVVRFDHNEEMADVSQDDFFKSIEDAINSTLESQSGAEGLERAELTGKERADYAGRPALRLSFKVSNYDNTAGESGFGEVLFIYVDGKTSYTIALEGHESDRGLVKSSKEILKSFRII